MTRRRKKTVAILLLVAVFAILSGRFSKAYRQFKTIGRRFREAMKSIDNPSEN